MPRIYGIPKKWFATMGEKKARAVLDLVMLCSEDREFDAIHALLESHGLSIQDITVD